MNKSIQIVIYLILTAGLWATLGAISRSNHNRICKLVMIKIVNESQIKFLDEKAIQKVLTETDNAALVGRKISEINLEKLENGLYKNPFVKRAEVYSDLEGNIFVETEQRVPAARVINQFGSSFYFDEAGIMMPLSTDYTARVPVVTGIVKESFLAGDTISSDVLKKGLPLISFIRNNEFWNAQISEIECTADGECILYPEVGNTKIYFGKPNEDIAEKFNNLMIFYKDALNRLGWSAYKSVNLKYKNQIVSEKN